MGDKTGISWTDATWNPLRGCSKVSAGCKNCYAETMAARFSGPGMPYEGTIRDGRWNGSIRLVPEKLSDPLRWKRPRRIFVSSVSDMFHDGVPFEYVAAVFGVMAACPQHTFQVLTKRPARAVEFFAWCAEKVALDANDESFYTVVMQQTARLLPESESQRWENRIYEGGFANRDDIGDEEWPLPNVHLGVSVEDQATADERIPILLQCPAAVRWVSYEPALAAVDFTRITVVKSDVQFQPGVYLNALTGHVAGPDDVIDRADWIVVGGESGPNARPFDVAWARSTVAQCKAAGVACFVKQMGANVELSPDEMERMTGHRTMTHRWKLNDKAGADPSEWPEDLRVQEFPAER